jgi:hypothetical protein
MRRDIVTQLSLWRRSALARPAARAVSTARAKSSAPASQSASSTTAGGGGFLAVLTAWLLLFGSLVIMPVAMLINGVEPEAVAGWMMMIVVAMAWTWLNEWWERRRWLRRHGKPKAENYPAGAAFREKWGTEERHEEPKKSTPETVRRSFWSWPARWGAGKAEAAAASPAEPVAAFVVAEQPSKDGIYDARPYRVVDAFADAMAEADRLGLTGEDRIEALANVLRGAGSKPAKQPASRGGAGGGPRGGGGRVEQGAERLGPGGLKGYLGGS